MIEFLVRDPHRILRPSEASLFRKIDRDHPTILLDEIDAIFGDRGANHEGIRAVFNAGNRAGTRISRAPMEGQMATLVEYDVFCPKATAGIGGLPDTILDRSIVIPMRRRTRRERVERLRMRTARDVGAPLRDGLAKHVSGIEGFTVADAGLPDELDDRGQDGWEPLVAIADAAGGDWPARARRAAIAIFTSRSSADDSLGTRLLADCHTVFEQAAKALVPTVELRAGLLALDGSRWADVRGREITPHYLAKLLRDFGIESTRMRVTAHGNPMHGYARADFDDAWERYGGLRPTSGTSGTAGTSHAVAGRSAEAFVPFVPLVPDAYGSAGGAPIGGFDQADPGRPIFVDDLDDLVGLA